MDCGHFIGLHPTHPSFSRLSLLFTWAQVTVALMPQLWRQRDLLRDILQVYESSNVIGGLLINTGISHVDVNCVFSPLKSATQHGRVPSARLLLQVYTTSPATCRLPVQWTVESLAVGELPAVCTS